MVSTCPSCLSQIDHEDHLFEVSCDCGTRFNPFITFSDTEEKEPQPLKHGRFDESDKAFEEIQSFGKSMAIELNEPAPKTPAPVPAASPSRGPVPAPTAILTITAADSLPTKTIKTYLPPLSVWAGFDSTEPNPLWPAFEKLGAQAAASGAHAVLSVRWQLTHDSAHILVTGSPVILSSE